MKGDFYTPSEVGDVEIPIKPMTSFTARLIHRVAPFKITDEIELMFLSVASVVFAVFGTHMSPSPLVYNAFVATVGMGVAGLIAGAWLNYAQETIENNWFDPVVLGSVLALMANMMLLIGMAI